MQITTIEKLLIYNIHAFHIFVLVELLHKPHSSSEETTIQGKIRMHSRGLSAMNIWQRGKKVGECGGEGGNWTKFCTYMLGEGEPHILLKFQS